MLTHTKLSCATKGCYAVITVHPQEETRLRESHETFYCPAGHSNYFPGKTPQEKRIAELERQLANRDRWMDEFCDRIHDQQQRLVDMAHAAQVCPLGCGWHGTRRLRWEPTETQVARFFDRTWTDLRNHLADAHDPTLVTVGKPAKPGEATT